MPFGLAFDSAGDLYADIQKFTPDGVGSVLSTDSGGVFFAFTNNAGGPLPLPIPEPTSLGLLCATSVLLRRNRRRVQRYS